MLRRCGTGILRCLGGMSRLKMLSQSNSRFVNTVLSVNAVLVTVAICASVGMAIRMTGQLAVITTRLDTLQINYEDAKVTMKALEFVTRRISDNHSEIAKEFSELRSRLRELERAEKN